MIRIVEVRGREVLDSRGRPTVEAEAVLSDGTRERASVPSGASTGRHEAHELRDGDPARYDGLGVLRAVRNVTEELGPAILGRNARDQAGLDDALVRLDGTPDRSRLGANALLAVSLAVARAAATASGVPVWRYLGGADACVLPLPMVNIVSGGLHAGRNLDFQDFLVIPVGARSYSEALESATAVYRATAGILAGRGLSTLKGDEGGFGPELGSAEAVLDLLVEAIERTGRDVALALDVAATHLYEGGRYRLPREGLDLDASGLVDLLAGLAARYPLVSIEDGLAEDDWDGWRTLTADLGSTVQLVGDDLFTTSPERLRRGIERGAANAILVKMNQIGTLTETLAVVEQARRAGYRAIVSARSGETEDPFLADLAVATGAGQIKVGSVAQSERLAKYNQLLRIEEELGGQAEFPGGTLLR